MFGGISAISNSRENIARRLLNEKGLLKIPQGETCIYKLNWNMKCSKITYAHNSI